MKRLFGLSALLVAGFFTHQAVTAQQSPAQEQLEKSRLAAPDNTGKNKRDNVCDNMTADKSAHSKGDMEITQRIRKAIMSTKGLSIDAQNVKIITQNGAVTLRGPVDSADEKTTLDGLGRNCSAATTFTNELEVKGR